MVEKHKELAEKVGIFGDKSRYYRFEEKDVKESLKRFKRRIKKYYKEDVNNLQMSFDLFCLELNNEFGSSLCN